jgi:hypothetical protein
MAKRNARKQPLPSTIQERALFQKKWYDYRAIPHEMATLVCISHFVEHIRVLQKHTLGEEDAVYKNVLKGCGRLRNIFEWKWWRTFEVIRQFCDKNCMPYGYFWETAIQIAVDKGYPRPSMVNTYLSWSLQESVLFEFKRNGVDWGYIRFSKVDIFKAENYKGLKRQDEYYWYLIRSVKELYSGSYREEKIGLMVKRGQIAEEFLKANNVPYVVPKDLK